MNFYDSLVELFPKLAPYRKVIVAFLVATAPFVLWLTAAPHTASEIVGWSAAYLLSLFGVYEVENGDQA